MINSDRRGRDLLDDRDWTAARLVRWGGGSTRVGRGEREALRDLRALLGRLAERLSGDGDISAGDVRRLNTILAAAPSVVQLERVGDGSGFILDMQPVAARRIDAAIREIAGSFAAMLRREWPPRLKLCDNADCRVAFYDESKNRSRRWCDGRACGNRLRVRTHRARAS